MATLDCLPGIVLFGIGLLVLRSCPADSGGVEQDLRPHQGGDTGSFGIPLIPTYEHTNGRKLRLKHFITEVSGCEVKFLVISRIIGNMHLAIFTEVTAI